jgi:hypothetical protein
MRRVRTGQEWWGYTSTPQYILMGKLALRLPLTQLTSGNMETNMRLYHALRHATRKNRSRMVGIHLHSPIHPQEKINLTFTINTTNVRKHGNKYATVSRLTSCDAWEQEIRQVERRYSGQTSCKEQTSSHQEVSGIRGSWPSRGDRYLTHRVLCWRQHVGRTVYHLAWGE